MWLLHIEPPEPAIQDRIGSIGELQIYRLAWTHARRRPKDRRTHRHHKSEMSPPPSSTEKSVTVESSQEATFHDGSSLELEVSLHARLDSSLEI